LVTSSIENFSELGVVVASRDVSSLLSGESHSLLTSSLFLFWTGTYTGDRAFR